MPSKPMDLDQILEKTLKWVWSNGAVNAAFRPSMEPAKDELKKYISAQVQEAITAKLNHALAFDDTRHDYLKLRKWLEAQAALQSKPVEEDN